MAKQTKQPIKQGNQRRKTVSTKPRKVKRYYTRTIDLAFLLVLLIVAIYSFYKAFSFRLIPLLWLLLALVLFLLIFIALFKVTLKRKPRYFIFIKRVFIIILCICLGSAGYLLSKSKSSIEKMNALHATSITNIFVITRSDDQLSDIDDLTNLTIGFQNGADQENADYVYAELNKQLSNYTSYRQLDYTTLINDLEAGRIDALVISEPYYDMAKANTENFASSVKQIATFQNEKTLTQSEQKDISKEAFTIYLSGIDNVGSPDQKTRSDTNLLLIVNPLANHIDMVSLPRDGYIPNPALNNQNDKLTHTGLYGIETSVSALEQFFQIHIDYYARVSFNSLIAIIDAIGGIDVDVEIDFCEQDENRSFKKENLICLTKGKQHLNGKQALAYARHRKTPGYDNPGRERAQQRIIKAIIDKLVSPKAVAYLNTLLDVAPNYIITDMPPAQISNFVSSELKNLKPWSISSIASDTGVYDSQYTASISSSYGPSDVYLFNKDEVQSFIDAYHGATNRPAMNTYSFDLTDYYQNTHFEGYTTNIVWDYMASNPH